MIDDVSTSSSLNVSELVIRQVTKADLAALEWDGEYIKYRRMFANLYRDSRSGMILMWIIEHPPRQIIGQVFVLLRSSDRDTADGKNRAYIFAFRVKSEWRNRGVGQHLMAFIEDDLHQRGFRFVTLNVAKDNQDAQRLYYRLGYKITGSQPGIWSYTDHKGHIHHVNEPAWRMVKELSTPD